ncbi:hypothetical protein M9H77_17664 [Catharanthus roseus]|uniref:Uncharacterized protein n=1 Tax=Catharanthus roseus TaxID=4058 RepID=A0ACC0B591_CATRO|nr:hypothetical protein M9H77_17664 [Catharanthus roseus]
MVGPNQKSSSLIYAFVARGSVILAEHTDFSGNFNSIAFQCLQKLPANSNNNKFTFNADAHTFNYLVDNGFTYCVVAEESAGRQIPIAFLERVKDDFLSKYGGGKAAAAPANGLNKEFGYHVIRVYAALLTFWSMLADMNMLICRSKLKEHMRYCVDHPEEISKLAKVKAQVSEVKGVMMENIEKYMDICYKSKRNIMRACTVSITPDCDEIDDTKVETWCPGLDFSVADIFDFFVLISVIESFYILSSCYGLIKILWFVLLLDPPSSSFSFCGVLTTLLNMNRYLGTGKVLDRGEKIELLVDKTENLHNQLNQGTKSCVWTGLGMSSCSGLQKHWNTTSEENVAAEHEDQVDRSSYHCRLDSHHSPLSLQRFQLWKIRHIQVIPSICSSQQSCDICCLIFV